MLVNINGIETEMTSYRTNIGGVIMDVPEGYVSKGGILYPWSLSKETPLGELAVGTVVKTNVDGTSRNFIVIHQGVPSSTYDSSCNGTWLLMEDIYVSKAWYNMTNNSYSASTIRTYLNSAFLNLLDSNVKSAVKTVKIPYTNGTGKDGSLATGSSGLSTQVFLLSYTEVGFSGSSYANVEGSVLSYFDGVANSDRIGYLNGTATRWWLRSPTIGANNGAWYVDTNGSGNRISANTSCGIRPAIILPSDTVIVDGDFNIVV